jgi:hypothetical protein
VAEMQPILYKSAQNIEKPYSNSDRQVVNQKSKGNGIAKKSEKRKRNRVNKNRKNRAQRKWDNHKSLQQMNQTNAYTYPNRSNNYQNRRKVFYNPISNLI